MWLQHALHSALRRPTPLVSLRAHAGVGAAQHHDQRQCGCGCGHALWLRATQTAEARPPLLVAATRQHMAPTLTAPVGTTTARRCLSTAAMAVAGREADEQETKEEVAAAASAAPASATATTAITRPSTVGHCSRPLVVLDLAAGGPLPYGVVWRWQQRLARNKVAAERRLKQAAREVDAIVAASAAHQPQSPTADGAAVTRIPLAADLLARHPSMRAAAASLLGASHGIGSGADSTDPSAASLCDGLSDVLLLVEHHSVFTLGRNATLRHLRFPSHVRVRVPERGDVSGAERPQQGDDVSGVEQRGDAAAAGDSDGGTSDDSFSLVRVERGGEVTYHGPGQLLLYPLLSLSPAPVVCESSNHAGGEGGAQPLPSLAAVASPYRADLHWFLRGLESVVIRFLRLYDIDGERIEGASGVWVRMQTEQAGAADLAADTSSSAVTTTGTSSSSSTAPSACTASAETSPAVTPTFSVDASVSAVSSADSSTALSAPSPLRKIAALGLSCSGWVTMHGCALNVDADLRPFDFIVPCGLDDAQKFGGVTSLQEVIDQRRGRAVRMVGDGESDPPNQSPHQLHSSAPVRLDHSLIRRQLLQCFRDEFGLPPPSAVLKQPTAWLDESAGTDGR